MFVFFEVQSCEGAPRRSPADVIFVDFDGDGAGTWYIRKEDVDSLPLEMVFANRERRHGVSIVYVSTGLQGVVA